MRGIGCGDYSVGNNADFVSNLRRHARLVRTPGFPHRLLVPRLIIICRFYVSFGHTRGSGKGLLIDAGIN